MKHRLDAKELEASVLLLTIAAFALVTPVDTRLRRLKQLTDGDLATVHENQ